MTEFLKNLRLRASRRTWDYLAGTDPLWAVLSDPARAGGRWTEAEFLATGEDDVADLFRRLDELGVTIRRGSALDFGCGAGRLSRALSRRFQAVLGVDISQPMIELAQHMHADVENLRFEQVPARRLSTLKSNSFDFVYSRLVLQHIQPELALEYIGEFIRVVAPEGVAVFGAPAVDPRSFGAVRSVLRVGRELLPFASRMSVSAIPRHSVERAVQLSSGRVLAALSEEAPPGWPGFLYVTAKLGA